MQIINNSGTEISYEVRRKDGSKLLLGKLQDKFPTDIPSNVYNDKMTVQVTVPSGGGLTLIEKDVDPTNNVEIKPVIGKTASVPTEPENACRFRYKKEGGVGNAEWRQEKSTCKGGDRCPKVTDIENSHPNPIEGHAIWVKCVSPFIPEK